MKPNQLINAALRFLIFKVSRAIVVVFEGGERKANYTRQRVKTTACAPKPFLFRTIIVINRPQFLQLPDPAPRRVAIVY